MSHNIKLQVTDATGGVVYGRTAAETGLSLGDALALVCGMFYNSPMEGLSIEKLGTGPDPFFSMLHSSLGPLRKIDRIVSNLRVDMGLRFKFSENQSPQHENPHSDDFDILMTTVLAFARDLRERVCSPEVLQLIDGEAPLRLP